MNEKILRALVEAGAIRRLRIIAEGALFQVQADTQTGTVVACTLKGPPKTWGSLDAVARWARNLGVGSLQIDIVHWQPAQRALQLKQGKEQPIEEHEAKRIAQQFVGISKTLTTCKGVPGGVYLSNSSTFDNCYIFSVVDDIPMSMGATRHVAVSRSTGVVTDLGKLRE